MAGLGRTQTRGRKLSMEALFALGTAIGTMLKMGRTTQAAQHAQTRINDGKGFPLMRKFMRPANPAEVRTYYKGPWGTSSKPGAYTYLAATGQCLDTYDRSLRPIGAIEAEGNRVYRPEPGVGKTRVMKMWKGIESRFAEKEN